MIFEFSSELPIEDSTIVFKHLKSETVNIKDFEGNESKCAQCMMPLKNGERVLLLYDTILQDQQIEMNKELYVVHIKNSAGNLCLEEFISRLLNTLSSPGDVISSGNTTSVVAFNTPTIVSEGKP